MALLPFHLSMCVGDLATTREFYSSALGLKERRATKTSVHFDFYGSQITFHTVEGYSAKNIQREVDAENVPVPHFGVCLPLKEWEAVSARLTANKAHFLQQPHIRFVGLPHEQHVLFVEDPFGNGIEIKSFTKIQTGEWI
jgi:extradiol dioxygenase family protein